ncbi:MAG: oxygen-independent coproporphyrinogen III oxidase [Clostridia bacterium]|nr:oxygen-independent coproporphyrinogen III oxidase [Clostridia bacterium]
MSKLGIYVHIPFCIKKCNYCDFNSFPSDANTQERYIDALINEIKSLCKIKKISADSVFIGGGTPTILSDELLEKLILTINENFDLAEKTEFTIECNPKTASLKSFKLLKSLGVNRLSIGVQSLDDKILKTLGRSHNVKDFLECYAAAKIAGFENINFDLMFAVPNQTQKSLEKTVKTAVKFEPTHISAYGLQLEENTYFYENKDTLSFPSDEQNRKMYDFLISYLEQNGYFQYEISNFAKKGFECKHNLKYWDLTEYVGVGLGASSFYQGVRYQNPEKLDRYFEFANSFVPLWEQNPKQTENDLISEFMFLGLRLNKGVSNSDFMSKFDKSMFDIYKDIVDKNIKAGLLNRERDRIFLSKKGFDFANTVMSDFLLD